MLQSCATKVTSDLSLSCQTMANFPSVALLVSNGFAKPSGAVGGAALVLCADWMCGPPEAGGGQSER